MRLRQNGWWYPQTKFSWIKIDIFWLKFHWNLFQRVKLTILVEIMAWQQDIVWIIDGVTYWSTYVSLSLNELMLHYYQLNYLILLRPSLLPLRLSRRLCGGECDIPVIGSVLWDHCSAVTAQPGCVVLQVHNRQQHHRSRLDYQLQGLRWGGFFSSFCAWPTELEGTWNVHIFTL